MGARGPAGKPTSLRLLHGDRKSRVNTAEPRPRDVPLTKPDGLSPNAAAIWDQLRPDLEAMGTVKASDALGLAMGCEVWARANLLNRLASHSPPVWKRGEDDEGHPIHSKNPLYSQARDATDQARIWLREFGLTPSARAGLRVDVNLSGAVERLFTGSGS